MTKRRKVALIVGASAIGAAGLVVLAWPALDDLQLAIRSADTSSPLRVEPSPDAELPPSRSEIMSRLRVGMSRHDVRNELGEPRKTQESRSPGRAVDYWYYAAPDGMVQVVFYDDELHSKNAY